MMRCTYENTAERAWGRCEIIDFLQRLARAEVVNSTGISDHMMIKNTIGYENSVEQEREVSISSRTVWENFGASLTIKDTNRYLNEKDPDSFKRSLVNELDGLRKQATKKMMKPRKDTPLKP